MGLRQGCISALLWAMCLTTAMAGEFDAIGRSIEQEDDGVASYDVGTSSACWCDSCGGCHDECGNACCARGPLLGFIQPTDTRWSGFISPMTNPVFFEDPRTLTEARLIFIHHKLPSLLGGAVAASDLQVVALQMRAALTEDLSIIATKDGFVFASPDAPLEDGWADISLGLKYNLCKDVCAQRIVSAGFTFELPTGSPQALQGRGDGEFNLFLTGGARLGALSHLISTAGVRLPTDRSAESSVFYWSNHFDHELRRNLYGFVEFNWYHWMGAGDNGIPGMEGLDFFNLGSTGVAGNDIVTGAFGFKITPTPRQEIGIAWEVPLTDRRDVIDNRLTADWILRY